MEYLPFIIVFLILASITALYFYIGYRFLKKHRGKKDADN
jgi:uncharacterized membrane-anchored protein